MSNRLTKRIKNNYPALRGCGPDCPFGGEICKSGIERCPLYSKVLRKLAEYEEIIDLDQLKADLNRNILMNLPVDSSTEGVWIYSSHLGGEFYSSMFQQDWDDLYCEECGDSDREYGFFQTFLEAWDGCGGEDEEPDIGLFVFLVETFFPEVELHLTDYDLWYEWDPADDEDPKEAIDQDLVKDCIKRLRKLVVGEKNVQVN